MIQETSGLLLKVGTGNVRQESRVDESESVAERSREPQEEAGEGTVRDSVTLSPQAMAMAKKVNPTGESPEVANNSSQNATGAGKTMSFATPQFLDIRV